MVEHGQEHEQEQDQKLEQTEDEKTQSIPLDAVPLSMDKSLICISPKTDTTKAAPPPSTFGT